MATLLWKFGDWFWSEDFWLPANVSWKDLGRNETVFIPTASDLWIPIPMAVGLLVLRLTWERFVAVPVGRMYKMKETNPRPPPPNPVLESAFKLYRKNLPKDKVIVELSKKADMTTRQVERWWRKRRIQNRPSEMNRFRETSWRFLYYLSIFIYGLCALWDKPWFWDTKHCWYNYPRQHVSPEIWWYYMIELSFYWSLIFSLFMDVKRKDFVEMVIHHIATISLMVLSWANNMVRVGSLVLVCHDAVDYWMEGGKLCKYMKYQRLTDVIFVIFTIVWFVTRLCIYPLRILRCTLSEGHYIAGFFPAYYVYNVLLCMLQVLHIFWFYTICRMVYYYIVRGQVEKDERSETEPEEGESEDEAAGGRGQGAGKITSNGNPRTSRREKDSRALANNNHLNETGMRQGEVK